MRKAIWTGVLAVAVAAGAWFWQGGQAQAGACGLKPLRPLGCRNAQAVCRCSADGRDCRWEWICDR
jgi:hypothetical protein